MGSLWRLECALRPGSLRTFQLRFLGVLAEVVDFVNQRTRARVLYEGNGPAGLIAESEEEMDLVTRFIDEARAQQPKFNYQRNTVYLRFCHSDYHKGAALAELSRLLEIPRQDIFAAAIITMTFRC